MKDSEKVDFGPLDPSQDEARWQLLVGKTAQRARERRRHTHTVSGQLVTWGRGAVAVAAALAVVVWSGSWLAQRQKAEPNTAPVRTEQAALLLRWALNNEIPPPEVLLQVMGDSHGER